MGKITQSMKKFFLILLIIVVCAAGGCFWYFNWINSRNYTDAIPQVQGDFKLGSINVCGLSYGGKRDITEAVLLKAAQDNALDVLLIEEFPMYPEGADREFAKKFRSYFPYISIKDECAVLSKMPILEHERKSYLGCSGAYSSILLGTPGTQTRVIAVHLRTTGMSVMNNGRGVDGTDDVARLRQMMRDNRVIRINQAKSIRRSLFDDGEPLIIAGDFNSVAGSRVYRILMDDDMNDSFLEAGCGRGSTYRLLKDKLRIDYILYNDHFDCVGAQIIDDKISDHRMVISTFNRK